MDKEQALHRFWSSFGLPAYDEYSVPEGVQLPYITYNVATGAIEDIIPLHASLWYRSLSWADVTAKAYEIAQTVAEHGHLILPFDGGRIYLTEGSPFSQRMDDPDDRMIRRIYINLQAEFLTAY